MAFWIGVTPTAYFKFNEASGNATDSSGNGHTLTNTNVTYAAGQLNNSSVYDNTAYFTDTGTDADFDFGTSAFSIAFWIKTTDTGTDGILTNDNTVTTIGRWNIYHVNGVVWFNSGDNVFTTSTINDGNWHRVVIVREGTGVNQTKIYLDGNTTPDKTGTVTKDFTGGLDLIVGAHNNLNNKMTGELDDVQIFNGYAWTTDDVTEDWNSGTGKEADDVPVTSDGMGYFVNPYVY